MREVIEEIFNLKEKSIHLKAIVDNKSTVDAVHSTTAVGDRKLRRDVSKIKQLLNEKEISSVQWCPGNMQLADCMTKRTASSYELLKLFQTGKKV